MAAPSQIDLIAIIQCQAYVRGFLERRNYKWIKSVRETRHRAVKEIYTTELTYNENLTHVLEVFKKPLEEDANGSGKMVTKDDVRLIFSEIPVMVLYSNQLIAELETNVIKCWSDRVKVGTVFLKMLKFFKGYSQYVNVYERARDQIAKLRTTNAKFAVFLRDRETHNGVPSALENILITPVQRIPRYEMLLSVLLKNTWKTHPDYQNLVEAYKMASTISEQVNDMKRQRESHDKLLQVYNMLTIGKKEHWDKQLLVEKKTRVFVREGTVTEHMIRGEPTKFFALLFNDLLLWTKPKKTTYEFKASNDLKNAKVELKTGSGDPTIHLRCEGSMRVFRGESDEDTQKWFSMLKSCIAQATGTTDTLQITTSTPQLKGPLKSDLSNSSLSNSSISNKDLATRLAKDERRKPRGIRSTQLKLTELRFLDDIERSKNERIADQVASIRNWQTTPDRADLARFEISDAQVEAMFHTFSPEIYQSFHEMARALSSLSLHGETPEIVLLGRQGSGKTSLLNALLGYPLPLEDLKRPLFIHMTTNPAHPAEAPSILIRKDFNQKPKASRDVHVSSPDQLAKELLRRASKEYSEAPIHVYFEAAHVLNCTIIDTPGLDAFQFHDEPQSALPGKNLNHMTVRSLVYEVARLPHRHLFFVEECKHKGLMGSVSGLATVVDPNLTRSRFIFTKFYHELRDMWQYTQLNAYLASVPQGSFFVTMPSADSLSSARNNHEIHRLHAQAYARDLEIMDMLQYDTKYAAQIGIHNLRRHIFSWIHTKHIQGIPRALEQLNAVTDTTAAQFAALKPRMAWTNVCKLRQVANAFTYDVVKVLPEILFGSTQVEAKVHGHTLNDERYKLDVPHTYWVDLYNQPIISDNETFASKIAYQDAKLYGSAQIIRLFSVFNAIVQELQLRNVPREDIAAAVGHSRALSTRDYYLSAALTLAHNKAESTLLPLVEQLCQRAAQMIKRLGAIATRIVGDGGLAHGLYKHEMDIPLFIGHVRVLYEHYGALLAQQCRDACAGALDQVLVHDVQKYHFEIPKVDTEAAQAEAITSLVAAMFTDISRLFVRNVTAKCYDILVARGMDDIGKHLQLDIAGLTESDLLKLFDVNTFKMALEADEKGLKAFDATTKAAHASFSKAVNIFSDTHHRHLSKSISYKKLSYDASLDSSTKSKKPPKAEAAVNVKITTAKPKKEAEPLASSTPPSSVETNTTKATGPATAPTNSTPANSGTTAASSPSTSPVKISVPAVDIATAAKASAKKSPIGVPKQSPGTAAAKEVIPTNNAANKKAAFEKTTQ